MVFTILTRICEVKLNLAILSIERIILLNYFFDKLKELSHKVESSFKAEKVFATKALIFLNDFKLKLVWEEKLRLEYYPEI